jgi:hypothetical protein
MGQPLVAQRVRARDGPSHKQTCRLTQRLGKGAVSGWKLAYRWFKGPARLVGPFFIFLSAKIDMSAGLSLAAA